MNQYRKRIDNLLQRKEQRLKTPIVIADVTEHSEYVYKGVIYSKEKFEILMKKAKPKVNILDDTKAADASRTSGIS